MQITDHDLRQLDAESVHRLVVERPEAVEPLMLRLVDDLKEARERLNQNPDNSSRPPSSRDPWPAKGDPPDAEAPAAPRAARHPSHRKSGPRRLGHAKVRISPRARPASSQARLDMPAPRSSRSRAPWTTVLPPVGVAATRSLPRGACATPPTRAPTWSSAMRANRGCGLSIASIAGTRPPAPAAMSPAPSPTGRPPPRATGRASPSPSGA